MHLDGAEDMMNREPLFFVPSPKQDYPLKPPLQIIYSNWTECVCVSVLSRGRELSSVVQHLLLSASNSDHFVVVLFRRVRLLRN